MMKWAYLFLLGLLVPQAFAAASEVEAPQSADDEELLKEDLDRDMAGLMDKIRQAIQEILDGGLGTVEDPWLPFVPLITLNTVSLALTQVSILYPNTTDVRSHLDVPSFNKHFSLNLTFPYLTLYSGRYISGGHALSLPFVGKSTANITMSQLRLGFVYDIERNGKEIVLTDNSTYYGVVAEDIFVNFADLNPGRETGVLINDMLSLLAGDLLKWVNEELKPGGSLHEGADSLLQALINKLLYHNGESCHAPELQFSQYVNSNVKDMIGIAYAFPNYIRNIMSLDIADAFTRHAENFFSGANGIEPEWSF